MAITRREWLGGAGMVGAAAIFAGATGTAGAKPHYAYTLSDADWRKRLGPAAYAVLRQEATERAWTSPLEP